jgi:hypothetical protein
LSNNDEPKLIRRASLEVLFALAIIKGSLVDILTAITKVLFSADWDDSLLRLAPFFDKLNTWQIDLPLSPVNHENLITTASISPSDIYNENDDVERSFLESYPEHASIANDGAFLFIHDASGLLKVATTIFEVRWINFA